MPSPEPGIAYTPEEAAEFLRWSPGGLRKAAQLGRIQHTRLGGPGGAIRFTADDMAAILAASKCPAAAPAATPPIASQRTRRALPSPPSGRRLLVAKPVRRRKRAGEA